MSCHNCYNVNTKSISVHPTVETVVRISRYAKSCGISRALAAARLLESHPEIQKIELDEEGKNEARSMVEKNLQARGREREPTSEMVFR